MKAISDNIKKYRTENNITQENLAERLNVTRQAVSNWENGKTEPDIETLTKMAQIFDISIDELVDGIPKGITELRGKKAHLKIGIIFTFFYVFSSLIFLTISEPLQEYVASTYNTFAYFIFGFIWKPLSVISGGIGISSLVAYSTGFYVKNKIIRNILIIFGILCSLFTTFYLIYIILVYQFELKFPISPFYYVFLLKKPFVHAFAPVLLFFGLAKK